MDSWFIFVVSLCVIFFVKAFVNLFVSKKKENLPPGPSTFPIIGNFLWLTRSFFHLEPILRDLMLKHGPFVTLRIGSRPALFIGSHSLAYKSLVQKGAIFSDRPRGLPVNAVMNKNRCTVSSAAYGPNWRLLRRNLTSEIFHPSRVKSYSHDRGWVLGILMTRLQQQSGSSSAEPSPITVVDHFQYAMFCLLVLMCFGDRLNEEQIRRVEAVQRNMLLGLGSGRFNVLNFMPRLGRVFFRNRWKELIKILKNQKEVLIPLIQSRIRLIQETQHKQELDKPDVDKKEATVAYVDTLVEIVLPDEKRNLDDEEMVSLCSEFLNAGTDTTSTALQWIMANLVKNPQIQAKLFEEIESVVGSPPPPPMGEEEVTIVVKDEDLQKMTYLKAVVLEGLRRHPPGHFVLPHTVTEDVELGGYVIPKNAAINFMVAEMGRDPKVWEDPMEFKPERFLFGNQQQDSDNNAGEMFDITSSREIKMMPFGAGRRICPGASLALLHLEFFVANLVWYFKWTAVDGDTVDLSEKQEFTVVMKNPLKACISARNVK